MHLVSPKVKFSYNIAKGSPEARRNMASKLNEQLFQAVQPEIKDGRVAIQDFDRAIHSVMPEDVNVEVKNFNSLGCFNGQSKYIYDKEENLIGQTIEIPTRSGKILSKNLPVTFHESRHVMDTLCNPKMSGRVAVMEREGLYTKKFNKLYENEIYNYEDCYTVEGKIERLEKLKKKILKFLKGKSVENQVNCIQDMRYSLQTEYNAYGDAVKFARKLHKDNYKVDSGDMVDDRKDFMFLEKIALLKKIGFEIIQAERERHRLSLEG